jgi:hypothetical protein
MVKLRTTNYFPIFAKVLGGSLGNPFRGKPLIWQLYTERKFSLSIRCTSNISNYMSNDTLLVMSWRQTHEKEHDKIITDIPNLDY